MASELRTVVLPPHGGQLRAIAAKFSVPEHALLDFSASIYPDGPSRRVLEALADATRNPESIRAYPDLESLKVRETVAGHASVPFSNVLVANGIAPLLSATLRAIKACRCMLPIPAFGEYRRTLHREGVISETYLLTEDTGFQIDLEEILAACGRRECDTLILSNPHNPTGLVLHRAELQALVQNAESQGIRILLDEAFIDFVPEDSVSGFVPQSCNLVVFRSVTKFFSMAGLRVAYMVAPQRLFTTISDLLDPWPISTLASMAAVAAVTDSGYIAATLACNERERETLCADLTALGLKVYPSAANFLFFRLVGAHRDRKLWERLIREQAVVIRNCATFEGLDETYFRVAVRGREDNERLRQALDAVLNDPA